MADKRYQMKRTVVQLTFISCNSRVATGPPKAKKAKRQHCFGDPVLISSSLVGLMRHFYLNGTKVTKKKSVSSITRFVHASLIVSVST